MSLRPVKRIIESTPTVEGAGVRLRRAFGFGDTAETDPFLLFDDFRNNRPEEYLAGFPWHPHRGIETITYVLAGTVEHGDSLGNRGALGAGDVQWMTAGSGIVHQEMPQAPPDRRLRGFQLWVNLPAARKMCDPRYRGVLSAEIPAAGIRPGVTARVIAGEVEGVRGPVRDLEVDVAYLDVAAASGAGCDHPVPAGHRCCAYVVEGEGGFAGARAAAGNLVLFAGTGGVAVEAGPRGCRYLLLSGQPLGEPVAWYGPIVMNTERQLEEAFREYREGTFVKVGAAGADGSRHLR